MSDSIDALIDRVIRREGGYGNNGNDSGPTKSASRSPLCMDGGRRRSALPTCRASRQTKRR